MNKLLLIICIVNGTITFGQDTIVDSKSRHVIVSDSVRNYSLQYEYKHDYRVKDGKAVYTMFNGSESYIIEGQFISNSKSGIWKSYENDTLKEEYRLKNSQLNGVWRSYEHGFLVRKGKWKNDNRIGMWEYFNKSKLIAKGRYLGKKINIAYSSDSIEVKLPNDSLLVYHISEKEEFVSFLNKFDVWVPSGNFWIRKGVWKYYSNGVLVQKIFYGNNGFKVDQKVFEENTVLQSIQW